MRTSWTVVSSPVVDGAVVLRDVAYGEPVGAAHLLDLYLPVAPSGPAPLVIWSGGSAWLRDDGKQTAATVAASFARRGYAVAGVSVRSSAQAVFPTQLDDAKEAVRWLRGHADEHGLDPSRFAFMGNSSGGWVATMVALTAAPGAPDRVQAAVDLFGPTDFLQMDAHMVDGCEPFRALLGVRGCHDDPGSPESLLLGGPIGDRPEACARANPVAHVTAAAPPFLILHGQADPYVPHHQSELLYAALAEAGVAATFYSIPAVGHEYPYLADAARAAGYVVRSTGDGEEHPPPTWETVAAFLASAFEAATAS
jgi:acetyl esterase/lipase